MCGGKVLAVVTFFMFSFKVATAMVPRILAMLRKPLVSFRKKLSVISYQLSVKVISYVLNIIKNV